MKVNYDNIIEFENEHSGLDFKSVQYDKEKHAAFLKDIIALANAEVEGVRVIIIGIKHKPNGNREVVPIREGEFVDQATYQQLVRENVEPELMITYDPYEYKEKLIGIIRIFDCSKRPYMLKKDFSPLKKGDCFIRKGSHQVRALRADFDMFYESRKNGTQFYGNVSIGFSGSNYSDEIKVSAIGRPELPSTRAEKRIKKILAEKKKQRELFGNSSIFATGILDSLTASPFASVPYEKRTIETLEENLESVKETYQEDDLYEVFEVHAYKLNFDILNRANEYVRDATCVIEIEKNDCFLVADHIFEKPQNNHFLANITPKSLFISQYPTVEKCPTSLNISQHIGDIKHQMPCKAFGEDIRLTIFKVPNNGHIQLRLKLFAKNLPSPLMKDLRIIVEEKKAEHSVQADPE